MDITSPIHEQLPNIPLVDEDVPESEDAEDEDARGGSPDEDNDNQSVVDDGSKSVDSFSFQNDDVSLDEAEEKARLIAQVLELQNTLDDLSQKVDSVKEENLKLKSENQVLGQYIENLMAASNVFQSTTRNARKKDYDHESHLVRSSQDLQHQSFESPVRLRKQQRAEGELSACRSVKSRSKP